MLKNYLLLKSIYARLLIQRTYSQLHRLAVWLLIALFVEISAQSVLRSQKNISSMIQVPGKINLADPGIKPDGQLTQTLNLLLESGSLTINFEDTIIKSSDLSTG